ncbi:MAG TPA: GNAT family N-acetyltransferase [Acidimicrobiia bacterium]|nr:GNAT family N-acetyltransferase [Acidimicrobiia bacterium]
MTIRDATRVDLDEILALVRELADYEREPDAVVFDPDEFAGHLFGEGAVARALIATHDDGDDAAVAGMALYYRTFSTWLGRDGIWLEDLFVRPRYRRHGYGRALLEELRARTEGRVEWAVLDWNESAQEFYRSLGAQPVDGWTIWRWPPVASRP